MHAVPYQDAPQPPMTDELARGCARALHVITPEGQILRAGRATLYVVEQLGWRRLARAGAWRPLVWLVEAGYWAIARTRRVGSRLLFRVGKSL